MRLRPDWHYNYKDMRYIFLPNKEQSILKRRYLIRVAIVGLFLLSVVGLIGIGSLFPAYLSVYVEEQTQINTVASLKKDQVGTSISRLQDEMKSDAEKIRVLSSKSAGAIPSELIELIAGLRGQVRITSIILNDIGTTTAAITLGGIAPTRESLVSFKNNLQELSINNKVDLPISGFAKSKDIPFNLKLIHLLP
jgi:hypothetical protein